MLLRIFASLGAIGIAAFGIYYQLLLKEILTQAGYWKTSVGSLNNAHCTRIPELQACEKAVRHQASGILYFACSTPTSRTVWEPGVGYFNVTARSLTDHVTTLDPATSKITRLKITGFPSSVPLALHGFDVVPSNADPSQLFVYLINHRPPPEDTKPVFADSVIEVFKTKVNSDELVYITTVEDPSVIITPNDVVGYGDGSFHFTNDARSKLGIMRTLDTFLRLPGMSVGYCHIEYGCKLAVTGLRGANGIARGNDGLYFVANDRFGEIFVLEMQDDHSLVLTDTIRSDMPLDNISVDDDGVLYIAALPNVRQHLATTAKNPTLLSPSSVLRLSRNTGTGQFYGQNFKVEKIFADDGNIASTVTSAIWDAKQRSLYLTGMLAEQSRLCIVTVADSDWCPSDTRYPKYSRLNNFGSLDVDHRLTEVYWHDWYSQVTVFVKVPGGCHSLRTLWSLDGWSEVLSKYRMSIAYVTSLSASIYHQIEPLEDTIVLLGLSQII